MMSRIFISRKIPGDSLKKFEGSGHEISISEFDRPLSEEEFLGKAKGADAVLTMLTDKVNAEVIEAIGPGLKIVSNYAVGFDNIKVEDATSRGVVVTNTPSDEVNEAVAEHTWSLILSLARRIVESDEAVRRGAYKGWEPGVFLGRGLRGKTLGIIGLGRIGTMTAKRAKGFEMRVLYNKRTRDEKIESEFGFEFAELDKLLAESDFISLHIPLTDETRGMANKDFFGKFKKGSFFVNTARGACVVEQDLVDAIREGQVGGAALDVFENEPNINPELIAMENVILTPHTASATFEAREKMGEQAVDAILKVLAGEMPENIVNKDVWASRRQ